MKEEDYRIKMIGDDFEFLPEGKEIQTDYERLLNNIRKREKILSDQQKIKPSKKSWGI